MILSIDLGRYGAMVIMDENQSIHYCIEMPVIGTVLKSGRKSFQYDYNSIHNFLFFHKPLIRGIYFEDIHAQPTGSIANLTQGDCRGLFRMASVFLKIPYYEITPQTWKKYFGLIGQPKSAAVKLAKGKYPKLNWSGWLKKNQEGLADAILIGLYSWGVR
jgi:hypothetical protein